MLALESGDVDLIFHVPPQEAARLAKNPNLVVSTPPSARVIWIYLNTQRDPFRTSACARRSTRPSTARRS